MRAITAHFRYISKNGRLEIEGELGNIERVKDALRDQRVARRRRTCRTARRRRKSILCGSVR